ncbi:unnamed protein product [Moneuplotes crassus]|uniref:DUF4215 domain-containing protein n=1 Tax=Euplotes crassus TaxID=5936 RepID=A0AAD1ULK5_EUPCR|nr:unnamed protein product [Moneuplotes crassus]
MFKNKATKSSSSIKRGWNRFAMTMNGSTFRSSEYHFLKGHTTGNNHGLGIGNKPYHVGCKYYCYSLEFILHSIRMSNTVDYTVVVTPVVLNPYGSLCGDGTKDTNALEECDIGVNSGDNSINTNSVSCDENCFLGYTYSCDNSVPNNCFPSICGDGLSSPSEACDDGDNDSGDGCSNTCTVESGYQCYGIDNQTCEAICGDGIQASSEQCDDGNFIAGDGCAVDCTFETDFACTGQGTATQCSRVCGNGILLASDDLTTSCDDGNLEDGDGCDSNCARETGYTCTSTNLAASVCEPICGDGLRLGSEACDDTNLADGDGCSSNCTIEDKSMCVNQTPTGPSVCRVCVIEHCKECDPSDYDKCQTCEDLYELKNPTTCYSYAIFEVSEGAQQMSSGSQAVSGVSAGATVGVSLLNLSSLAAIWSIVNQLQLFLLLLLTKTPFPGDVKALILGNELMQFNLDVLPVRALPKMPEVMDWLKIDQDNSYLETIGVESSTSLLNNFGFVLCMLLMLALYPLVMTLKFCVNYENENKCSVNYLMILIIDLFNFTIYIRLVLGGFQLLLICCISEVIKFDLETIPNIISMVFSVLILTVCVGTIALSFYIFYSKRDFHDPDKYYKLNEFITGLKNTRYARIYPFLGLMRRTMFVIWLLTFTWLECVYLTAGMMVVQILFVLSLVTLRPFDRPENNLIEIVNEIIYTTLLSIMIICDKVDEWSSTVTNIFCYIILANSLVITFIMIGALLVSLCQKCAKKKSGTTTSRVQPIQEVSQQRMGNTYNTHRVNSDLSSIKIITTDDSHNIAKLFEEARKKSKNSKMQTKRQEIKF